MTIQKAVVIFAVVTGAAFAWIFRYEPIRIGLVWDRWTHRTCTVDWSGDIHCAHE